jgi:phosphoribosylglycinamide formyltransferase-1
MQSDRRVSLAVFASGSGTNAENIIQYFHAHSNIIISCIITNNPQAGVIERAKRLKIPCQIIDKTSLNSEELFFRQVADFKIDAIVLAGYLLRIPEWMVHKFHNKIINIHPALLPKYGGKGMYGMHVHEAVKNAGEKITGISIHLVNENYDEGSILLQAYCDINEKMTAVEIAEKVHKLEYAYYPACIEYFVNEFCVFD